MTDEVKFNARVEPPHGPILEEPYTEENTEQKPACCEPPAPCTYQSDPLIEVLPTVLVGIGVAWLLGIVTGACIFSPTSE